MKSLAKRTKRQRDHRQGQRDRDRQWTQTDGHVFMEELMPNTWMIHARADNVL